MSWHPLDIDSPEEVSDEELFNILASDKTPTQYLMEKRYEELVRTNSELHEYRINH